MLSSPYLNTKPETAAALANSPAEVTVVVASDASHGFAGATGLSYYRAGLSAQPAPQNFSNQLCAIGIPDGFVARKYRRATRCCARGCTSFWRQS